MICIRHYVGVGNVIIIGKISVEDQLYAGYYPIFSDLTGILPLMIILNVIKEILTANLMLNILKSLYFAESISTSCSLDFSPLYNKSHFMCNICKYSLKISPHKSYNWFVLKAQIRRLIPVVSEWASVDYSREKVIAVRGHSRANGLQVYWTSQTPRCSAYHHCFGITFHFSFLYRKSGVLYVTIEFLSTLNHPFLFI